MISIVMEYGPVYKPGLYKPIGKLKSENFFNQNGHR